MTLGDAWGLLQENLGKAFLFFLLFPTHHSPLTDGFEFDLNLTPTRLDYVELMLY